MTEYCFSSCLSDFVLFCSYILCHPLYFSYLIFVSPYLVMLLSFLSPLFITATLLTSLFTTPVPSDDSKEGYLLSAYNTILKKVSWKAEEEEEEDEGLEQFEELEAYEIVFGASTIEVSENPENLKENPVRITQETAEGKGVEESPVESALKIEEGKRVEKESVATECEMLTCSAKSREDHVITSTKSDKVEEHEEVSTARRGSEAPGNKINNPHHAVGGIEVKDYTFKASENLRREGEDGGCNNNGREHALRSRSCSRILNGVSWDDGNVSEENSQTLSGRLGSFGSMRKEKDWRRTLACKLFEERHNVDTYSGEGLDLLWEIYAKKSFSNKTKKKEKTKEGKEVKVGKNGRMEEEEDEEVDDGQLCCLRALKFSAGKMNLGMGRPNLVKISKAFKGIGWLHSLSKHGRKVHEKESSSNKTKKKEKLKKGKEVKVGKNGRIEEEEDEVVDDGQSCCLRALKFSAGKMNLGMGRPNLVKIYKAFKGGLAGCTI
ncbi:hypothetical protein Ancab_019877 [Ancistrocladus abbreviatus]